jgi:hypothetical protein
LLFQKRRTFADQTLENIKLWSINKKYMQIIERKDYMNTLIGLRNKNLIKVLTGVRRCGNEQYQITDNVVILSEQNSPTNLVFMI